MPTRSGKNRKRKVSRQDYFQVRSDTELANAIRREAKAGAMEQAELTRQLLRIIFGLDSPSVAKKLAELRKREPRMTLAPLVAAMVESYLDAALQGGVDSRWHPTILQSPTGSGKSAALVLGTYLLDFRNALVHGQLSENPELEKVVRALLPAPESTEEDKSKRGSPSKSPSKKAFALG